MTTHKKEKKINRNIGEEHFEKNVWRKNHRRRMRKTNKQRFQYFYELFNKSNIYEIVKSKMLQWLGRLGRTENTRIATEIAWTEPGEEKKKILKKLGR